MSVADTLTRIAEIQALLAPRPAVPSPTSTGGTFAEVLDTRWNLSTTTSTGLGAVPAAATGMSAAGDAGARMVALAQAELGVAEQPPGSNEAPRIAEYRTATAGSGVGPWCAYFTSWVAQQAGAPLGEAGQGFGAVAAVADWAQRTGRWTPAAAGLPPRPGDLIVWDGRHIGIVESVGVDGSIHTIEGNSDDAVARRAYGPDGGGATGYVRVG